jgi:hypothetical protein
MEKTIIQWNIYNWITVLLMAAIGMAFVGAGASFFRQYMPGSGGGSGGN